MTGSFRTSARRAAACLAAAIALFAQAASAQERPSAGQIFIVGSSTVFPFAAAVVETFGRTTEFPSPHIEPTGTGGGINMFCQGIGLQHPDIANASRRIKQSELDLCRSNTVEAITEVKIGYDGIVVANADSGPDADFSLGEIYLALAKTVPVDGELVANPYDRWNEIAPDLPDVEIKVLGPPPTSGTRDAFVELVMEVGCEEFATVRDIADEGRKEGICATMREDGHFVEAGESDNVIVRRLLSNPDSFGVFGYSFYEQNEDLRAGAVDGVEPTFENIAQGEYAIARSLFFYVKNAHLERVPGLKDYVAEFVSDRAIGGFGYLVDKGLIPLPQTERETIRERALAFEPLKSLEPSERSGPMLEEQKEEAKAQ